MTHRADAPDPNLHGLPIRDFATICNAITRLGAKMERRPFTYTTGGKSHGFAANLMGIPVTFEAVRDYRSDGYALKYRLNGAGWYVECLGSTFPPGNADSSRGHYNLAPYARVQFAYLRGNRDRYIFGFRIWGCEGNYKRDMALLRLMIPSWEVA